MLKRISMIAIAAAMSISTVFAGNLINGAGSTFVYPAMTKWFDVYSKDHPDVQFNYQAIGSGGGIKQISAKTVDFGATDGPMTQEQMGEAPGRIYHIPVVMGAVAVAYNLPGVSSLLKLTPDIIADMFLGKITHWDDSRITSINPGVTLPNDSVVIAHRSDGSGTSFIFTDYLSSVSPEWKSKVGKGTAVNWPVGLGGKGNEGVAGILKQTPGAIGYVELAYAVKNNLSYAQIKNASGAFIEPSIESTSEAASGVVMPEDFRVSIVNSSNPKAYPIAGFTWVLIYKEMGGEKGQQILDFIKWAVHEGQKYTADLYYAPLPNDLVAKIDAKLAKVH